MSDNKEQSKNALYQLHDMWIEDSVIDNSKPNEELARMYQLHAKYLKIHGECVLKLQKVKEEYNTLYCQKKDYYTHGLDPSEYPSNWEQEPLQIRMDFDTPTLSKNKTSTAKVIKYDASVYLNADIDLNKILRKKIMYEEMVSACGSILDAIKSSKFSISKSIEWMLYVNGLKF